MIKSPVLSIGVMTGNSVDGVDAVLTAFYNDGRMRDLCSCSLHFDAVLYEGIRSLQQHVSQVKGQMDQTAKKFHFHVGDKQYNFDALHQLFIERVANAVKILLDKARNDVQLSRDYELAEIDLIGFHGQTCDHFPPSRASDSEKDLTYTVQIGSGQELADITGITVVYDFRSDDLMMGGEGAPLAPIHNQHLAESAQKGLSPPITFCNAGNSGNLAHITHAYSSDEMITMGWDTGPCNHYPDHLMRKYTKKTCDLDGALGATGSINRELLQVLFDQAVLTSEGNNYLLEAPPKSGDPNFYIWLKELDDAKIPLEDRVRTAEYFAAYIFVYSLSLTPDQLVLPSRFAVFGGGWCNPLVLAHFKGLLAGDFKNNPILSEHLSAFSSVRNRLQASGENLTVDWSDTFGFDGRMMEARIFADMAYCRLMGKIFSTPKTTGVKQPTVGGIIRFPNGRIDNATQAVRAILKKYNSLNLTQDNPQYFDARWSRAAAGWSG